MLQKSKRTFGVKAVVFRKVEQNEPERLEPWEPIPTGMCVCGKSIAQCCADWDKRLGVTSHASDSAGGVESAYQRNVRVTRMARLNGDDPYCFDAWLTSLGYVSQWTPKRDDTTLLTQAKGGNGEQDAKANSRGKSRKGDGGRREGK